jgi:hypothetical protein
MWSKVGFASWNRFFFANGAEAGGVRERDLGSPTHPLAHRGAWRRRAGRGSSAPPLRGGKSVIKNKLSKSPKHNPQPPPPPGAALWPLSTAPATESQPQGQSGPLGGYY